MSGPFVSAWKDESVHALIAIAERFLATEVTAKRETWESQHFVDREVWLKAAEKGLLYCSIPEEYGGGGGTIAHDLAVCEAQYGCGETSWGNMVHSGIVASRVLRYGTESQRRRWLPHLAAGTMIGAIAMTEPEAGSDLQGVRTTAILDGDHYVLNGAKTFISNGSMADPILVVTKTAPRTHGPRAYHSSRSRRPIVPASSAVAMMETAVRQTVDYVKQRPAFGGTVWDFQNTRFTLAECTTRAQVARTFVDRCVELHLSGALDTTMAAMAKWWITEQQMALMDECVQLHGGYGYMREYAVARMYQDSRVQKIYGGANEVMKEIVARSL